MLEQPKPASATSGQQDFSVKNFELVEDNSRLHAALWYAAKGFPVLPLRPRGKEPLTAHGFKDASTDSMQITKWWQWWPDANIGMATGCKSGLLVLDPDPRNGAPTDRTELIQEFGPVPETAESITGGGGRHLYFRHLGKPLPKTLRQGVDLKGDGGYVVVPPSVHPNGIRYQ